MSTTKTVQNNLNMLSNAIASTGVENSVNDKIMALANELCDLINSQDKEFYSLFLVVSVKGQNEDEIGVKCNICGKQRIVQSALIGQMQDDEEIREVIEFCHDYVDSDN